MGYTPPYLNVRKISGGYNIFPDGVTTDDLDIYSNPIDTTPRVQMMGAAGMVIYVSSGWGFAIYDGSTEMLSIDHTGGDVRFRQRIADHNLFLDIEGNGYVKFGGLSGTYVAGAATDSIGYLPIKDSGGTTRKLMIQA